MALTDFYASDTNAYKGSIPIDLQAINILTSGWSAVVGKNNVWQYYFPTYAPKIVSEQYATRAPYGKPYTKALDLQSLDMMIQGGWFYDPITKYLYVKCFNLAVPNQKQINVSNAQSIESRVPGFYIHQSMRLGNSSGIKFNATIGLGENYIDGANLRNEEDFYFTFFIVDPEPTGSITVRFPTLKPYIVDGIKFPGVSYTYFFTGYLDWISQLVSLPLTGVQNGDYRYVYENDSLYRYEENANHGDVKPLTSNGTGVGTNNGWWIKVYGVNVEKIINEVPDVATLKSIGTNGQYIAASVLQPDMYRKVTSNGRVYRYIATASAGTFKPNVSDGTGNSTSPYWNNGWWIQVDPTEVGELSAVVQANHCALAFTLDAGILQLSAHAVQPMTPYSVPLEPLQKASFKCELELLPRSGSVMILDYTIKMTQVLSSDAYSDPQIYTGTIEGIPSTGNFGGYLVGFGMSGGVLIDDFVVSEIIESA